MKSFKNSKSLRQAGFVNSAIALLSAFALLVGTFALGVSAGQKQKARASLNEDQRILHLLNRLGYGARPGDVERVKAMGIESYINQQLHPEGIADPVAEAKIKDRNLSTLSMTTAELYEKFPQPGQLLRKLQQQGALPRDLAAARDNRVKGGANAAPNAGDTKKNGEAMTPEAMRDETAKNANPNTPNAPLNANPLDNEKYREAIREYYQKNGLQLPQRITAELQASRILRAVYSERQLNEVMVDFWTNHFNVFMNKGADRWLLTSYDRDTIRPNAMGNFYNLLLATAESPAMLFYLDNFQSVSQNARLGNGPNGNQMRHAQAGRDPLFELLRRARNPRLMTNNPQQQKPQQQQARRGINENYARELMELHTLGVDGGYTQKDVQEVARCFTGWTIFAPRGGGAAAQAIMAGPRAEMLRDNAGKFFFNSRAHDDGEKIV